ncbi:flagellar biosynthetic protein FliR [Gimibacter soli]|uniref:Flagellar biosynthetic protein FliR n=1 Tax=Gimibacter soli TaxID=3024400 RepID=A0AAE9XT30_9PROT|nr:flagellar biosynthetic protein FliR [Gimibacter soli]WCL52713.1 flagellar biosynthetic protein FliR [Gimibacter soli]
MLDDVLPSEIFGVLLVLTRVAALVMLMPGLGDASIPAQIRVSFAFLLSIVVYPVVAPLLPAMPPSFVGLVMLMLHEAFLGILIALIVRIFMSATHVAGTIIAYQSGLAAAQSFDPTQGTQSAIIGTFMTLISVTLVMVTNTHHLMIMGMVNSYTRFPANEVVAVADFARVIIHYVGYSFQIGMQLAAPFIVYGLVYNVGLGLIARMMPQFQVFFIGMPLNIFLGFALFAMVLSSMMHYFMDHLQSVLMQFLG